MKIGFVIGSLSMGGAERVVIRLTKALIDKGYQVYIYTTLKHRENEYDKPEGAIRRHCYCENEWYIPSKIRAFMKKDSINCAIIMGRPLCIFAIPALFGTKIPVIVSERSAPQNARIKATVRLLSNQLMKFADAYVFQTQDVQSYFCRSIRRSSVVIPNPIVVEELPQLFEGERRTSIVAVGRLVPEKNYRLLIDAFEIFHIRFPKYILEIFGEGKERYSIENAIIEKKMQDIVLLKGECSDVFEQINSAAMYVMSSDFEGMPNALLEAMAIGLPVISTDCPCGGPKEIIKTNNNGQLVPVRDVEALVNAMVFYAENRREANRYGSNAISVRDSYRIENIVEKWENIIEKVIRN